MIYILLLIIAILPVFLICLYVYKKDQDKESKKLLIKLFTFGILSCIPAVILELIIGLFFGNETNMNMITLFFYVFTSIALVEEFCKWFMTYKISYNHREFNHAYDAIVYCVFVSLGFAVFENILYVLDAGIVTGIARAISAIPGHACDAIIMGHYLGMSKIAKINENYKSDKKNLLLSIFIPAILHTIYDYCLFTEKKTFLFTFIIVLIFVYVYSIKKIKYVSNIEENFTKEDNNINSYYLSHCPICNLKSIGKYCANCGEKLLITKINDDNDLTQQV